MYKAALVAYKRVDNFIILYTEHALRRRGRRRRRRVRHVEEDEDDAVKS